VGKWSHRAVLGGFTESNPSPEMFTSKMFNTEHISAVAAVNIVITVLSRNIAFSFHLKRSVTLKKCRKGVCGRRSAPDPAGGAHDAPQTL